MTSSQQPPEIDGISSMDHCEEGCTWTCKKFVAVRGGGTLTIHTNSDDPDSFLYELKAPSGTSVVLRRYRGNCSIETFDPSNNKSRLISYQCDQ